MSQVYDIDPRVIERTRDWLISKQQADGSWKPDTQFINEGATNRFNSDAVRITAYIAWALENVGYRGPAIAKATKFIEESLQANDSGKLDAYTLAVLANFAVDGDKDSALSRRVFSQLMEAHQEKDDLAWWSSQETGVYSTGASAEVETTGLATQALLKSGESPEITRKALAWLKAGRGTGT